MLAKAAYLHLRARLRQWRGDVDPRFAEKLGVCEKCPLRSARSGVFYCGAPVWDRLLPTAPTAAGCGCPLHVKARDRESHCPLRNDGTALAGIVDDPTVGLRDAAYGISDHDVVKSSNKVDSKAEGGECECKWCNTLRDNPTAPSRATSPKTPLPSESAPTPEPRPSATDQPIRDPMPGSPMPTLTPRHRPTTPARTMATTSSPS